MEKSLNEDKNPRKKRVDCRCTGSMKVRLRPPLKTKHSKSAERIEGRNAFSKTYYVKWL